MIASPRRPSRRITIETKSVARNSFGDEVVTWVEFAKRWARKRDSGGREFFDAAREIAEDGTVWKLPYLAGLTGAMRISYAGQVYDIRSIKELGRKQGHEVVTTLADQTAP
jgi:SPP1 family predicted phage head-tail adaptor